MSPDNWQTLGQVAALIVLGGYTAIKARRAEKQTRSTGNGFAGYVQDDLRALLEHGVHLDKRFDRLEARLDQHFQWHSEAERKVRR